MIRNDNLKSTILFILLIISIIFHGIITMPKSTEEARFEIIRLNDEEYIIYDQENEKLYIKNKNLTYNILEEEKLP